jgi:hypothetical protein
MMIEGHSSGLEYCIEEEVWGRWRNLEVLGRTQTAKGEYAARIHCLIANLLGLKLEWCLAMAVETENRMDTKKIEFETISRR